MVIKGSGDCDISTESSNGRGITRA